MKRSWIRALIPGAIRANGRSIYVAFRDKASGVKFARSRTLTEKDGQEHIFSVTIRQPIHATPLLENKLNNLRLGISLLQGLIIEPGEIFSFWKVLGRPSVSKGYLPGRNLKAGKLVTEVGGGLCQLASIIYHASLCSGLGILERHSHSVDIYTDETRFTPLGADAAVVFGHKDLRVKNDLDFSVRLQFHLHPERLELEMQGAKLMHSCQVEFRKLSQEGKTVVETLRWKNGERQSIGVSAYN